MYNIFKINKTRENIAIMESIYTGYSEWKDCFGRTHKVIHHSCKKDKSKNQNE